MTFHEPTEPTAESAGAIPSTQQARQLEDLRAAAFPALLERLTPRPWVTRGLVAVNVLVYAAMVFSGVDPLSPTTEQVLPWGADYGPLTIGGEPWRLFTSTFVHFGAFHLAMNMWALWMVGRFVEQCVGSAGMIVVYVMSGLAGSLASAWWHPYDVSAGASGAVFGIVGVLAGVLLRLRSSIPMRVVNNLKSSLGAFLVYNIAFGVAVPFINMAAHLGGLAGGFFCGVMIARPLTVDGVAKRIRAALGVLCVGAVAVFGVYHALPRVPDFGAFVTSFQRTEQEVAAALERADSGANSGALTDAEAVAILESDVLAPWRAARAELASFRRLPEHLRNYRTRLEIYAQAQEEVWMLLAESLRTGDPELRTRAFEKQEEANRLAKATSDN